MWCVTTSKKKLQYKNFKVNYLIYTYIINIFIIYLINFLHIEY